jgi:hypothetical protein
MLYGSVVSTIVEDRLYLSGADAALNEGLIVDVLGITHIVNASNGAVENKFSDQISYMSINIEDSEAGEDNIGDYFDLVHDFLDEPVSPDPGSPNNATPLVPADGKRILFHCMQGVSRSATLLIAYLMKSDGLSLREAFEMTKSKRSKVRPNGDFAEALIKYEQKLRPGCESTASLFVLTGSRQKPSRTATTSSTNPMHAGGEMTDFAAGKGGAKAQDDEKAKTCCCVIS